MGIDFRLSRPQDDKLERPYWAYSGFNYFRKRLAKEIGIPDLDEMEGLN